jgi:hypothetical protein
VSGLTRIGNAETSARTVLRPISAAIIWIVAALVLGFVAYHAMYSSFAPYDDTGYWTIALRSYIQHGSLYNHTYTQCGPFYYEFWSCVYWLTGATVNPDSGYFLSLCAWIAASSLIGAACWLLTGWLTLGLCGVAASFILFETFNNEPMEPAHLSYVLMGLLFVAVCSQPRLVRQRQPFVGMAIGVLCAALVLTKVNIGLFATCGIAFTVGFCWPEPAVRRFTRPLASLGLLLLPLVVMWESLDSAALSHFSDLLILIELSTGALLAVLWATIGDSSPLETRTVS